MSKTITKIQLNGFRVAQANTELSNRTLFVGPNGSGKTAHVAGLHYLLTGAIPGYGPADAVLNMAGDDEMTVTAEVRGRLLSRSLRRGKTLSETLTLDGQVLKTGRGGAAGVIQAAFGPKPLLMDMLNFERMTSSEQRREILSLVSTPAEMAALAQREKTARDEKNNSDREKREAQATLATLQSSLAEIQDRPVGTIEQIKAEVKTIESDIKEVQKRVSEGKANDKARETAAASHEGLDKLKEGIAKAKVMITEADESKLAMIADKAKLNPPERPPEVLYELPQQAIEDLREVVKLLKAVEDRASVEPAIAKITGMVPNRKAWLAWQEGVKAHQAAMAKMDDGIAQVNAQADDLRRRLSIAENQLKTREEAIERENAIGPGLNPEDEATLTGLHERRDALLEKRQTLEKIEALTQECDKARLAVEKREGESEARSKSLAAVLEAQADIVMEARARVHELSAAILPDGFADLEDDGKDISIFWHREDERRIPWGGLSGGEKAIFDTALGHALAPEALVVVEGAECDDYRLLDLLTQLQDCEFQVVVLTCHPLETLAPGWTVVRTGDR